MFSLSNTNHLFIPTNHLTHIPFLLYAHPLALPPLPAKATGQPFAVTDVVQLAAQQSEVTYVHPTPTRNFYGERSNKNAMGIITDITASLTAPAALVGRINTVAAEFGATSGGFGPTLIVATKTDGCTALDSWHDKLKGAVALVARGTCNFNTKAKNAQDKGAIAVFVEK